MLSQLSIRLQVLLAIITAAAMLAGRVSLAQNTQSPTAVVPGDAARYADQRIRLPESVAAAQKQTPQQPAARQPPQPQVVKQTPQQIASQPPKATPPKNPLVTAGAAAVGGPSGQASLVRQAAHGQIMEELPPKQLGRSAVRQISHSVGCGCDHCSGLLMHGDIHCGAEPSCGFVGGCGIAGCRDPGCGFEHGYALEAACGVEAMGCDGYGCDRCIDDCSPLFRIPWKRFEFFAGVNSFTGPANHATDATDRRGGSGSFGFYEGFNEGRSLNRLLGFDIASQFGMRATQSSLSGAEFTEKARKQIFLTGGLFRRVDFGLQYGLVVDYLYDDWWYRNNLVQLRGELSWNDACGHEFGYQFMAGTKDSTTATRLLGDDGLSVTGSAVFEPTDQHRLFVRGGTGGGGTYMAFAGGTDRGDGLLGVSMMSAFRGRFAVQGGATYLIPNESHRAGGFENEAWNLSLGVVFRPGGRTACGRYCRPMFDVADNGTFLVDRR